MAKRKREGVPNSTLYVSNLNDKVAIRHLRTALYLLFSTFGHLVAVNAYKSAKMRGQAHIAFANTDCAEAALAKLQGRLFMGKPMQVSYAKETSKRTEWLQQEIQS